MKFGQLFQKKNIHREILQKILGPFLFLKNHPWKESVEICLYTDIHW